MNYKVKSKGSVTYFGNDWQAAISYALKNGGRVSPIKNIPHNDNPYTLLAMGRLDLSSVGG